MSTLTITIILAILTIVAVLIAMLKLKGVIAKYEGDKVQPAKAPGEHWWNPILSVNYAWVLVVVVGFLIYGFGFDYIWILKKLPWYIDTLIIVTTLGIGYGLVRLTQYIEGQWYPKIPLSEQSSTPVKS